MSAIWDSPQWAALQRHLDSEIAPTHLRELMKVGWMPVFDFAPLSLVHWLSNRLGSPSSRVFARRTLIVVLLFEPNLKEFTWITRASALHPRQWSVADLKPCSLVFAICLPVFATLSRVCACVVEF